MERNPITVPITKENFQEIWGIVDKERCTAKKKKFISGMVAFFGHMLFAALVMIAVNGMIYNHSSGSYKAFLDTIPYFVPLWEKYSVLLLKPLQDWKTQAMICALAVYAIDFVFCCILTLLLSALYHPLRKKLPTDTDTKNAKLMLSLAHDARIFSNKTKRTGAAVIWSFLAFFLCFILIQAYVIEASITMEQVVMLIYPSVDFTSYIWNNSFSLLVYLLGFILIFGYALIAAVHTLTVQFLYRHKVPYSFVAAVEKYYTFSGEETEGLSDEEIMVRRRETAEAKRKEALYLESINAYGKSKQLLAEAAYAGDVEAMEHYARHNLIAHFNDPARYWLEKAIESGNASPEAVKNLRRLKWHRKINVRYLNETDKVER